MEQRAKSIIGESIRKIARSDEPDTVGRRVAGEVDMAQKLGLISWTERDHLLGSVMATVARRRDALHKAMLDRLGIPE